LFAHKGGECGRRSQPPQLSCRAQRNGPKGHSAQSKHPYPQRDFLIHGYQSFAKSTQEGFIDSISTIFFTRDHLPSNPRKSVARFLTIGNKKAASFEAA
jgi:hypothetical protein